MEHAFYTDLFLGLYVIVIGFMVWKIKQLDSKDFVVREDIEHMVKDAVDSKFKPMSEDLSKFEVKMDSMQTQLVSIGVTLARIDERMKRE